MRASWRLPSWQLFAIAVAIWSTTWHAILYQLEHTPPELGVALRFGLAAALVMALAAWRGDRLRFSAGDHAWLALQGVFMYSLAYFAVYHAERHVPSGLVAVGYSASPLVNGVAAWCLWRQAIDTRFVVGGVMCLAGVTLIFWPELTHVGAGGAAALGAACTVAAVLLSAVGSLTASRNAARQLPLWPAIGWGMTYGAALSLLVAMALGQPLALPAPAEALSWWLSLVYLAGAGSVVAFACYLTLQSRVGPGASSTVGVATPVLALVLSALYEGFRPVALTWVGVMLAVAGNAMILRPGFRQDAAENRH